MYSLVNSYYMCICVWNNLYVLTRKWCITCSKESSVWPMLSVQSYFYTWLNLLWIIISYSARLNVSMFDIYFWLNIFTIVSVVLLYILHIVAMFLCPMTTTLKRHYRKYGLVFPLTVEIILVYGACGLECSEVITVY